MTHYEIKCSYCGTVVASTSSKSSIEHSVGGLLVAFLQAEEKDKLCCYHGECMVENYEINKVKTVKKRENLDQS